MFPEKKHTPPTATNFGDIPKDIILYLNQFMALNDRLRLGSTNRRHRKILSADKNTFIEHLATRFKIDSNLFLLLNKLPTSIEIDYKQLFINISRFNYIASSVLRFDSALRPWEVILLTGNLSAVKTLLRGFYTDPANAVTNEEPSLVKFILKKYPATKNFGGSSNNTTKFYQIVCISGSIDVVKYFYKTEQSLVPFINIDIGAKSLPSPLWLAVYFDNISVVKFFIESLPKEFFINHKPNLLMAACNGHGTKVALYIQELFPELNTSNQDFLPSTVLFFNNNIHHAATLGALISFISLIQDKEIRKKSIRQLIFYSTCSLDTLRKKYHDIPALLQWLVKSFIKTASEQLLLLYEFAKGNVTEEERTAIFKLIDNTYKPLIKGQNKAAELFFKAKQLKPIENPLNPISLATAFEKYANPGFLERLSSWRSHSQLAKKIAETLRLNPHWNPEDVMLYINIEVGEAEENINKFGTFYQMIETIREDYSKMQGPSQAQQVCNRN